MTRSLKCFMMSAIITVIILLFIVGLFTVAKAGVTTNGQKYKTPEINYEELVLVSEVTDNAITFISPETKAAAHWMLIVCAALSELY